MIQGIMMIQGIIWTIFYIITYILRYANIYNEIQDMFSFF